jgi:hypothetical protein
VCPGGKGLQDTGGLRQAGSGSVVSKIACVSPCVTVLPCTTTLPARNRDPLPLCVPGTGVDQAAAAVLVGWG